MNLKNLEKKLGYAFKEQSLLERALTHPSFAREENKVGEDYERLEFLGDAVLSLILAENLYTLLPEAREGELALKRSALIKGHSLSHLAQKLELAKHIKLGKTEKSSGGKKKQSILENTLEAIVGAIYLDSNIETTKRIVLSWYGDILEKAQKLLDKHNPKGKLQELLQKKTGEFTIEYRLVEEGGPDHEKTYKVALYINSKYYSEGLDSSKKGAEEKAAQKGLDLLRNR